MAAALRPASPAEQCIESHLGEGDLDLARKLLADFHEPCSFAAAVHLDARLANRRRRNLPLSDGFIPFRLDYPQAVV
jgi:hypothetical protein